MYWALVGKPEGNVPVGRPRRKCVDFSMDRLGRGCV